jgi:hypothetical protein
MGNSQRWTGRDVLFLHLRVVRQLPPSLAGLGQLNAQRQLSDIP